MPEETLEKHYYSQPEARERSAARARAAAELGYTAYIHPHMSAERCGVYCRRAYVRH